jgi:hypothetical protein
MSGKVDVRRYDESAQYDPIGNDGRGEELITRWMCYMKMRVDGSGNTKVKWAKLTVSDERMVAVG